MQISCSSPKFPPRFSIHWFSFYPIFVMMLTSYLLTFQLQHLVRISQIAFSIRLLAIAIPSPWLFIIDRTSSFPSFSTMVYNYYLIIIMLRLSQIWPVGAHPSQLLCPCDTFPLFFEHCIAFCYDKMSQAHLVPSLFSPQNQSFLSVVLIPIGGDWCRDQGLGSDFQYLLPCKSLVYKCKST